MSEGPKIAEDFFEKLDAATNTLNDTVGELGPYVLVAWNADGDMAMHSNLSGGDAAIAKTLFDASFHMVGEDTPKVVHINLKEIL